MLRPRRDCPRTAVRPSRESRARNGPLACPRECPQPHHVYRVHALRLICAICSCPGVPEADVHMVGAAPFEGTEEDVAAAARIQAMNSGKRRLHQQHAAATVRSQGQYNTV